VAVVVCVVIVISVELKILRDAFSNLYAVDLFTTVKSADKIPAAQSAPGVPSEGFVDVTEKPSFIDT
jgi:hypothetical protein